MPVQLPTAVVPWGLLIPPGPACRPQPISLSCIPIRGCLMAVPKAPPGTQDFGGGALREAGAAGHALGIPRQFHIPHIKLFMPCHSPPPWWGGSGSKNIKSRDPEIQPTSPLAMERCTRGAKAVAEVFLERIATLFSPLRRGGFLQNPDLLGFRTLRGRRGKLA